MFKSQTKGWLKHFDFIIMDIVCLELSYLFAFWIRHGLYNPYAVRLYRIMAFMLFLFDIAVIFFGNFYEGILKRGYFREAEITLFQDACIAALSSFYLYAIQIGEDYSRIVFLLTGVIYFLLSYTTRLLWKKALSKTDLQTGYDALLVATTAGRVDTVLDTLRNNGRSGCRIIGVALMDGGPAQPALQAYQGIPVVTTEKEILQYVCHEWVDEVLMVLPDRTDYQQLVNKLAQSGVAVHVSLQAFKNEPGKKTYVDSFGSYTVLTTTINYVTPSRAFIKRAFDIIGGLVGSMMALLAILIFGPMIRIQSPGPILFHQERVGRNGRRFRCYKIRSMVMGADQMKQELEKENRVKGGMMFKLDYDPRIIGCKRRADGTIHKGIGNFIRDWSIDELPQFFNVLKGDMSLVGTRPPTVDEWEKYQPRHRARLAFKPGITGLWQVSGRSEITDFEEVVKLDTQYINEWSLGLDCKILLNTIKVVLTKQGAM